MTLLRIVPKEGAVAALPEQGLTLDAASRAITRIAGEWGCEIAPSQELLFPPFQGKPGLLVLPEIIFRKMGILVAEAPQSEERGSAGLTIEREEDATTWEDFLLMKLAHSLAREFRAELFFEDNPKAIPVEPERFETFEHYVDKVLEFEEDVVKELKRVWIYAHRKRAVR